MWGHRCKCNSMCICPFSLGLAVGITCFLGVFIWGVWVMHYGVPPMMAERNLYIPLTWGATFAAAFWALFKGFVFAFIVALLYDCFACCFKGMRHDGNGCSCCDGHTTDSKTRTKLSDRLMRK